MGKKFVLIRKETDDSHHGKGRLLGELGNKWIFVDDFVSSGRTRQRVIDKVEEVDSDTEYVGQYMYVNYSNQGPEFEPAGYDKAGYGLW
jgi:orotate phosphoribosyltransferase-like protein